MTDHPGDLLSALLDGELTDIERTELEEHVARCEACATELRRAAEARDAVRALPFVEAPTPLLPHVRRGALWIKAAASVAAGLMVVGLVVAPGEQPAADLETMAGLHTGRAAVAPSISPLVPAGGGP